MYDDIFCLLAKGCTNNASKNYFFCWTKYDTLWIRSCILKEAVLPEGPSGRLSVPGLRPKAPRKKSTKGESFSN